MTYQKLITGGIKRLREKSKLTQEEFAGKINMSVQGYRNIEHNKYLPTGETIDKICEVFGISPVELLLPDEQQNLSDIKQIIDIKLQTCPLEKLIRINSMIDLM
ncbi:helix-turn-helix transcriptional regulator [bacterium]|nr:helix-turn-helix transcriptional regulator [bacterium]